MPSPRINVLVDGSPLDPAVLAQMTRAEVRESDCDPSVLALRFTLVQRPNGEFGPLDDGPFEPGAVLSFEVEPPGGLIQRLFEGPLTHVRPHFETLAANAYLEVLAMDAAVVLDAEERVAAYPNMSPSDVASQILSGYQIAAEVADTAVLYDEDRQLLMQRATDWRFLQHLAQPPRHALLLRVRRRALAGRRALPAAGRRRHGAARRRDPAGRPIAQLGRRAAAGHRARAVDRDGARPDRQADRARRRDARAQRARRRRRRDRGRAGADRRGRDCGGGAARATRSRSTRRSAPRRPRPPTPLASRSSCAPSSTRRCTAGCCAPAGRCSCAGSAAASRASSTSSRSAPRLRTRRSRRPSSPAATRPDRPAARASASRRRRCRRSDRVRRPAGPRLERRALLRQVRGRRHQHRRPEADRAYPREGAGGPGRRA